MSYHEKPPVIIKSATSFGIRSIAQSSGLAVVKNNVLNCSDLLDRRKEASNFAVPLGNRAGWDHGEKFLLEWTWKRQ